MFLSHEGVAFNFGLIVVVVVKRVGFGSLDLVLVNENGVVTAAGTLKGEEEEKIMVGTAYGTCRTSIFIAKHCGICVKISFTLWSDDWVLQFLG